jgi:hypothetical protein
MVHLFNYLELSKNSVIKSYPNSGEKNDVWNRSKAIVVQ